MAKDTFTVTLSDGTQLAGLELNGSYFVSKTEITPAMLEGKLSKVKIEGPDDVDNVGLRGEHEHMELVQVAHFTQVTHGVEDGYYFILRDIPASEREKRQLRADVDFALMLGGASF